MPSVVGAGLPTMMTMPPGPPGLEFALSADRPFACAGGTVDVTITVHNLDASEITVEPRLAISEDFPRHMVDLGTQPIPLTIPGEATASVVQRVTIPSVALGAHTIFVFGYTASVWIEVRAPSTGVTGQLAQLPLVDMAGVAAGYDLPELHGFVHTDGATAVCLGTGLRSTMPEDTSACIAGTQFRALQIVGQRPSAAAPGTKVPYLAVTSSTFRLAHVGTATDKWCQMSADFANPIPGISVFSCDIPAGADLDALTLTLIGDSGVAYPIGPAFAADDPAPPPSQVRVTFDGGCATRVPPSAGLAQVGSLAVNPSADLSAAGDRFVPPATGPALICRYTQVARGAPGTVWLDRTRRPAIGGDLAVARTISPDAAAALADAVRAIPYTTRVEHDCGGVHADIYTVIVFRIDGGDADIDLWIDGPGMCSSVSTGSVTQLDGAPGFAHLLETLEALLT